MSEYEFTAVIEQTREYENRMRYVPETRSFRETDRQSLASRRRFLQPYGWIKESGTPPCPHWDVIVMTDRRCGLGEEIAVRLIGVFVRSDGDHKFIAVERRRDIDDIKKLTAKEKADLNRLYPRAGAGEGFFGRERALEIMSTCEKAL